MDWRNILLAPVGVLLGHSKVASAERTTQRYLQEVNAASCLVDLHRTLAPLLHGVDQVDQVFAKFATTNSSGKGFWNRDSFTRYIDARLPGNYIVAACIPLLWQMFLFSAFFPFSAPTTGRIQASGFVEPTVDLEAFSRAFTLLVTRGFELFGAKQDGRPLSGKAKIETKYSDKVPRLTRIIFRSLNFPPPKQATQSQAPPEQLQLLDIKDTIAFTQPITYDSYPYGPSVGDEPFEAASRRLLGKEDERSAAQASSNMIAKADMKRLIQSLLVLRPEERRWRDGLFMHEAYQRSADVQYARSNSAPEEASQASDLASAFVTSHFKGDEEHISWDEFEAWCSACPPFIFLFFQLWASIFVPTTISPPAGQKGSCLPSSTANLLCLLNTANFITEVESKYRFHDNELQLQLDLQASALVADLATTPELNYNDLDEKITAKDRSHVLLIKAEDLDSKETAGGKKNRLIAAFLSPPDREMWREEGERQVGYVWRSSAVQLQPDLAMANSGGMSARVVSEDELVLQAHGTTASDRKTIIIKLRLRQRLVGVVGLETRPEDLDVSVDTVQWAVDNPFPAKEEEDALENADATPRLNMRLVDLKCYRLPGKAVQVTRWP